MNLHWFERPEPVADAHDGRQPSPSSLRDDGRDILLRVIQARVVETNAVVRLLGRYLNSQTEVKKLRDLRERAASERVERKYSPPAHAPERLTREQNEKIAELYRSGVRRVDIARIVGTTDWTVNHG